MTTALEIWQALGFAIPLVHARIQIGVSAMNRRMGQEWGGGTPFNVSNDEKRERADIP